MIVGTAIQKNHKKLVGKLFMVVFAMTGFGFAMVPLYDFICEVTGSRTKTGRVSLNEVSGKIESDRFVRVEFLATSNAGLPWEFKSLTNYVRVRPGEIGAASYYARNKSGETIVGQAVPAVSPSWAGKYLKKVECFCFKNQTLEPGQEKEMPIRFVVDPKLPSHVKVLTLSYTFMNTAHASTKKYGGVSTPHARLN